MKKVYVQAEAPFRMLPEDINKWYVRGTSGQMVPFSAFFGEMGIRLTASGTL